MMDGALEEEWRPEYVVAPKEIRGTVDSGCGRVPICILPFLSFARSAIGKHCTGTKVRYIVSDKIVSRGLRDLHVTFLVDKGRPGKQVLMDTVVSGS